MKGRGHWNDCFPRVCAKQSPFLFYSAFLRLLIFSMRFVAESLPLCRTGSDVLQGLSRENRVFFEGCNGCLLPCFGCVALL